MQEGAVFTLRGKTNTTKASFVVFVHSESRNTVWCGTVISSSWSSWPSWPGLSSWLAC